MPCAAATRARRRRETFGTHRPTCDTHRAQRAGLRESDADPVWLTGIAMTCRADSWVSSNVLGCSRRHFVTISALPMVESPCITQQGMRPRSGTLNRRPLPKKCLRRPLVVDPSVALKRTKARAVVQHRHGAVVGARLALLLDGSDCRRAGQQPLEADNIIALLQGQAPGDAINRPLCSRRPAAARIARPSRPASDPPGGAAPAP